MAEYEGHSFTTDIHPLHRMLDAFEDCEECVDIIVGLDWIECYQAMIHDLFTAAVVLEETSDEICAFDLSDGLEKEVLIIHLTTFFPGDVH